MADESDSAAVIAALSSVAVADYVEMSTMGLLISAVMSDAVVTNLVTCRPVVVLYEYVITFGVEVDLFWGKEITGASIVFFLNRYLVLAYYLVQLRAWFPLSGPATL
ncbi:hypothetical protein GSI_07597 [Ganoderma sinense ZZ0214-1]|uniref:DUF6533 domain-containing protein n=1 Tax=Ganoderma sinense ZZ0214-1 TaxID=1077348 RepID=A0A2G8S9H1_9APHY|nr:hypothetical protein GSI_07597 [Ganoderma sinense ZZ0214-1]